MLFTWQLKDQIRLLTEVYFFQGPSKWEWEVKDPDHWCTHQLVCEQHGPRSRLHENLLLKSEEACTPLVDNLLVGLWYLWPDVLEDNTRAVQWRRVATVTFFGKERSCAAFLFSTDAITCSCCRFAPSNDGKEWQLLRGWEGVIILNNWDRGGGMC